MLVPLAHGTHADELGYGFLHSWPKELGGESLENLLGAFMGQGVHGCEDGGSEILSIRDINAILVIDEAIAILPVEIKVAP